MSQKTSNLKPVLVNDHLRNPHPLIRELREHLKIAYADSRHGNRLSRPWKTVPIDVTKEMAPRALRIGDSLIKELKKRGYWTEENPTLVKIKDQSIVFRIEEPYKIKKKKAPKGYHSKYEYEYPASGLLRLRIKGSATGCRANFVDKPNKKVEECLAEFIQAMEINADKRIELYLERQRREEEWERQQEAKKKTYQDALAVFTREELKVSRLHRDAKSWKKSILIREYIEAVKDDCLSKKKLDAEKEAWIEWAHQQADRLDPLKKSPHSILDEPRPSPPSYW